MEFRRPLIATALAGLVLVAGAGCFNDAFRGHDFEGGLDRFALVIEADRTDVAGSHFLVDRATGDLWVLESTGRLEGRWVRLADAPADAKPFSALIPKTSESEPER